MEGTFSVIAIVAAYNEADIIGQAVGALIEQGISVYVIDNRSTDDTAARVRAFEGRGLIGLETFPETAPADERFDWTGLLRRKEELAETLDADWFIHHDADEFRESPWSAVGLGRAIEVVDRLGFNAIDFELFDFQLTIPAIAPGKDVRDELPFYARPAIFNKRQIRCWKKGRQRVDLSSTGGHEAQFNGRSVFPLRFILRHYPFRSVEQATRKVFSEQIHDSPEERERGWHVQYDDEAIAAKDFVRGTAGLTLYDSEQVRRDLWLSHRILEETLAGASLRELENIRSEHERVEREQSTLLSDLHTSEEAREQLERDVKRVRETLAGREADVSRLESELERSRREVASMRETSVKTHESLNAVARRVAELESSTSWRVTAPGRMLIRWLTGRRPASGR